MAAPTGEQIDRVRSIALRLLEARGRSRAELTERLLKRKLPRLAVEEVVARLVEIGLVDDAALAQDIVTSEQRARPAGEALLRHRLAKHEVDELAAEIAVAQAAKAEDEMSRAKRLATAAAAKLPGSLDAEARWRRVMGLLARRGFDEETAIAATEAVIGAAWVDEGSEDLVESWIEDWSGEAADRDL